VPACWACAGWRVDAQVPFMRPDRLLTWRALAWAAALCLAGATPPGTAATYTWTGEGTTNNWSNAGNWSGTGDIPNFSTLRFAGTQRLNAVNNLPDANLPNVSVLGVNGLSFLAGAGAFKLSGNRILSTGNITNLSSNQQTFTLPITLGASGMSWDGASAGITMTGALDLDGHSLSMHNIAVVNAQLSLLVGHASQPATLSLTQGSSMQLDELVFTGIGTTVRVEDFSRVDSGSVGIFGAGVLNVRNRGHVDAGQLAVGFPEIKGKFTSQGTPGALNIADGTVNVSGRLDLYQGSLTLSGSGHPRIASGLTAETVLVYHESDTPFGINLERGGRFTAIHLVVGGRSTLNLNGGELRLADLSDITDEMAVNWQSGTVKALDYAMLGRNRAEATLGMLSPGRRLEVGRTLTIGTGATVTLAGGELKTGALTLAGGSVLGPGRYLGLADTGALSGFGTVRAGVQGSDAGQTITASGGTLTLGDASLWSAVSLAGALHTGGNLVVLHSANRVQLGALTTLDNGGQLRAPNGARLGSGGRLSFSGLASIEGAFVNDGDVAPATIDGGTLTFLGGVTGTGNFSGDLVFQAGHTPGNAQSKRLSFSGGDVTYASTAVLTLDLQGLQGGSLYDQLSGMGQFSFNGRLNLVFASDFNPGAGARFQLFNFNTFSGHLGADNISVTGFDARRLDFSRLSLDGSLGVTAAVPVPEPGPWALLSAGLLGLGLLTRRRGVA